MSPETDLDPSQPKRAKTFSVISFSVADSLNRPVENTAERNLMETEAVGVQAENWPTEHQFHWTHLWKQ